MKISKTAEPIVRTAIHAAVKKNFSKLDATLQSFPSDEAVREGIALTLVVVAAVMCDIHQGVPAEEEIRAVSAEIARAESWAQPTEEQVSTFLLRLMNGEPFAGVVPVEDVIILSFVCAGNLLSSCHRDDEEWWDYLDRVEAALEFGTG